MSILDKVKGLVMTSDAAEWDATAPGGDESAYEKDYAAEFEYDHSQFVKEAE